MGQLAEEGKDRGWGGGGGGVSKNVTKDSKEEVANRRNKDNMIAIRRKS